MKRTTLAAFAALATLSSGSHLYAQECPAPLDGVPRSNFMPALLDGEPDMECFTTCRKVGHGTGGNRVCIRNTAPFNIWIVVCMQSTDGGWLYDHHDVPPGGMVWSIKNTFDPHWSWITHWAIIPSPIPTGELEFALSSSLVDARGVTTADTAGTVQIRHVPGTTPASRTVSMLPTGGQGWSKSIQMEPRGAGMQASEDWDGQGDAQIDQEVQSFIQREVGSLRFIQEVDRGKDGSIDHTACLNFWQDANGEMHLELEAFDGSGALESAFYATKVMGTNQSQLTTSYDHDGDGATDQVDFQTMTQSGLSSTTVLNRDLDADGMLDDSEITAIDYRGLRDASLTRSLFDGSGLLLSDYQDELFPVAGGYFMEGHHDANGDGLFDKRTAQFSLVGDFANGMDEDYFGIDVDNDGAWDTLCHTLTAKFLQADLYTEMIGTDAGADGAIDGLVVRTDEFSGR